MVRPFFAIAAVFFIAIAMTSDAIYDVGDGITHYQIARWSWKHPELFLHHWGKPVFTLIASPFAQFGYKGVVLFNVLCHLGAAWLTWRIADRMKLPFAFLAGPLLLFAPISFGVAQSGLTEPMFALTLLLGIYFVTSGRYNAAAVVISLLPFVRTEGFLLAPLFALFFLLRKEYKPILLLATGTVLYSILGGIMVHHDLLWVFHENPYRGEEAYGHGTLFHFLDKNEFIFGWAITALTLTGLLTYLFRKKFIPPHSLTEVIIIGGCFVVFFVAHSIFWWKGLFGSYGLIRVMTCILPCAVIIALRGLQLITTPFRANYSATVSTAMLVLVLTMFNSIRQHHLILRPDTQQLEAEQVVQKLREHKLDTAIVYYAHPLVAHLLDRDVFDNSRTRQLGSIKDYTPPVGAVLIPDPYFTSPLVDSREDWIFKEPRSFNLVYTLPPAGDEKIAWEIIVVEGAVSDQ
jgi:hypothetical protein